MATMRVGQGSEDLYVVLRRSSLGSVEEYTCVNASDGSNDEEDEPADNVSRTAEC